jgi:hypothetical protein
MVNKTKGVKNAILHLRPSQRLDVVRGDLPFPTEEEEAKILESETHCKEAFRFKSYFVTINNDKTYLEEAMGKFRDDEDDPLILAIRVYDNPKPSQNINWAKADHFQTIFNKAWEQYESE